MDQQYQTLEVDIVTGVATIWLSRPGVRNAMNEDLICELTAVLQSLGADPTVRVLVLAGRGNSFCAGADLDWMRRMAEFGPAENRASAMNLAQMLYTLHACPKPTIARVHGPAFAGGMGLASACDIRIATPEARFCLSEVRIGLVPATISPYVVNAMGAATARRYMLTAEQLSAAEAHRIGFVHFISTGDMIDDAIGELSASLISGGPSALARTKHLLIEIADRPIDHTLLSMTADAIADVRASAEGREGVRAFFEKRRPAWGQT